MKNTRTHAHTSEFQREREREPTGATDSLPQVHAATAATGRKSLDRPSFSGSQPASCSPAAAAAAGSGAAAAGGGAAAGSRPGCSVNKTSAAFCC